MEYIMTTPYLIRILITLAVILLLNKKLNSLIFSTLGGTVLLAFWCGHDIPSILKITWTRFSSTGNILLIIVIIQVIWLSSMMEKTGVMKDLVEFVRKSISRRAGLAVLPALIGWLPMPGGAIFSAPMVHELDTDGEIAPLLKTKINYWFRHVWEYWWPLYPGVLLAMEMTELPLWQFVLLQLPLSLFSIAGGIFFLLKKVPHENRKRCESETSGKAKDFILLILPILVVIFSYMVISILFPKFIVISRFIPMVLALFFALITLQIQRPLNLSFLKKIVFSSSLFKMVLIVVIIRIYGAFIEFPLPDGTLLMSLVRDELALMKIPVIIIIMLIPFVSGLATGIAIGFVGASFPIIVNLLGQNPLSRDLLSYTVIGYSFGYIGMMLSPVHVCHVVTNEYFKTDLSKSMIRLVKPSLVVLAGGIFIAVLVRIIL
jgi:uncharacterized protein